MPEIIEVKIPDIGDFEAVPVIDVLVKPGDVVKAEDSIVTLESDKATMDVPSPAAGTVTEVKVKVGDKVAQGTLVLLLEIASAATSPAAPASTTPTQPSPFKGAPASGDSARRPRGAVPAGRASADIGSSRK